MSRNLSLNISNVHSHRSENGEGRQDGELSLHVRVYRKVCSRSDANNQAKLDVIGTRDDSSTRRREVTDFNTRPQQAPRCMVVSACHNDSHLPWPLLATYLNCFRIAWWLGSGRCYTLNSDEPEETHRKTLTGSGHRQQVPPGHQATRPPGHQVTRSPGHQVTALHAGLSRSASAG